MYLLRDKYLSHINTPDKITLLRRLMDQMEITIRSGVPQFSDFLDPYERKLAKSIVDRIDELECKECIEDIYMERKIIVFSTFFPVEDMDKEIVFLKITSKFKPLDHRKVLGSILGLGIERSKIGDISILGKTAHVAVKKEIGSFLLQFMNKVGREGVKISQIDKESYTPNHEDWKLKTSTVTSMRLDSVISDILKIPRSKAKNLVEKSYVKVDFQTITTPHFEVNDSLLSVRGYGRFLITNEISKTKKGRIRFTFGYLEKEK